MVSTFKDQAKCVECALGVFSCRGLTPKKIRMHSVSLDEVQALSFPTLENPVFYAATRQISCAPSCDASIPFSIRTAPLHRFAARPGSGELP